MAQRNPFRLALFAVLAVIVCFVLLVPGQFLWFRFMTHRWESQIRHNQNPAELQTWAVQILEVYGHSNIEAATIIMLTNKPPAGIPTTSDRPRVAIVSGAWSGQNEDYVSFGWGSGVVGGFGVYVGSTNFVCRSAEMWKPGIYFVRTQ